jgi:hypothetical protein
MTDQELRPEVVAALVARPRLSADRQDAILDANPAELAVAARQVLDEAARMLVDAGVLRPQRTALDLTCRHVQALAAAYGTLAHWWDQPGYRDKPLATMLKVIPEEHARWVLQLLWWGGWVAEAPNRPEGE